MAGGKCLAVVRSDGEADEDFVCWPHESYFTLYRTFTIILPSITNSQTLAVHLFNIRKIIVNIVVIKKQ